METWIWTHLPLACDGETQLPLNSYRDTLSIHHEPSPISAVKPPHDQHGHVWLLR